MFYSQDGIYLLFENHLNNIQVVFGLNILFDYNHSIYYNLNLHNKNHMIKYLFFEDRIIRIYHNKNMEMKYY